MFRTVLIAASMFSIASAARAEESAFDRLDRAYAPYLDHQDPFAWPAKVRALTANECKFWRGSKDLFFHWCKTNCADWAGDQSAYVAAHGDLHMGNIGTYPTAWGDVGFGMVDFDDAARLPFQIDLLEGFITLRLMSRQSHLPDAGIASADAALVDAYRIGLSSTHNAGELLAEDKPLRKMIKAAHGASYDRELERFCDGEQFKTAVRTDAGKLSEILTPVNAGEFDAFATAISEACANDAGMAKLMRDTSAAELRKRICAVSFRLRFGSAGSQGLRKYLVLLDHPLAGINSDAIIYLKEEIPCAAERQNYIAPDARSAGERAKRLMDELTSPKPLMNSFAMLAGRSYWVSVKEPWSDELSDELSDGSDLLHAANVWGIVAGTAHRAAGLEGGLAKLDAELVQTLKSRADAYLAVEAGDYRAFTADPRTAALKQTADEAIRSVK